MDPNLIIDDDYVYGVGNDCARRGKKLEKILDDYVLILQEIKDEALIEGEIANSLAAFIDCVKQLNDQITTLSDKVDDLTESFLTDINNADSYLF